MDSSHANTPLTLATKVTIVRILGIPVFILMLIYYKMSLAAGEPVDAYRLWGLTLFVLIAVTDALDGFLARSRDEETRLGAILDPIADKALLLSAIILLTRPSLPELNPQFPVWFTLIIISRDVVLVAGSYLIHWMTGHVEVRPRLTGKIATCLQMAAIIAALIPVMPVFYPVTIAAALFTLISGVLYIIDGARQLERPHHV
jgi:CDP-diacylglycerol--glycerol-3-phosphate 3-phosphatidyltransferase/cardiolipin synthase